MARAFTAASSMSMSVANAITSVTPFSMSCWVKANNFTAQQGLMNIYTSSSANGKHTLSLAATTGQVQCQTINNTGTASTVSTSAASPSTNTWFQAGARWTSTSSRNAVLNGTIASGSGTSVNPTNINSMGIGAFLDNAPDRYFDGSIAEAGIWNVSLAQDDWTMLAAGVSPLGVQPASLVAYWPLWGQDSPEIDLVGGRNLTLTNAPVYADHTRQFYFG